MLKLYYVQSSDITDLLHLPHEKLPETVIVQFEDGSVTGEVGYIDFAKWHKLSDFPYSEEFLFDFLIRRNCEFVTEDCRSRTYYYKCGCVEEVKWGHFDYPHPQSTGCWTCGKKYRSNPYPVTPIVLCDQHSS